MTAASLGGLSHLWVPDTSFVFGNFTSALTNLIMDAAGEGVHMVGTLYLEGGSGSKTLSSSGGKIHFLAGSSTFANAGTTLRIGVQDVDAANGPPARGDGTFDAYVDMVGSPGTITSNSWTTVSIANGSKTVNHGTLYSVAFDMSSRGGTDSVRALCFQSGGPSAGTAPCHMPQVCLVTSGPTFTRQSCVPNVVIEFDDGTLGFLDGGFISSNTAFATTSFDSGSTPDEYALIFQLPVPVTVDALMAIIQLDEVDSSAFDLILYSDPLGSPSAIDTISVDPNMSVQDGVQRRFLLTLPTARNLTANTNYAVAIRPTTANNVTLQSYSVATANHWKGHPLGTSCYMATRSDQTGAFTPTTTSRIFAGVRIAKVDDGAGSGGGGMLRHPGMSGGLNA